MTKRRTPAAEPRRGLLAGGNWIVDQLKMIDVFPAQDALANILEERRGNGGSPFNILIDLARLGASFPLEAVGLVGDDEPGRFIRSELKRHGIDAQQLQTTDQRPTSYTDVMTVRSTGRRTFFHQRGANALLDMNHFDFARSRAAHFHLGYLLLLDRLDRAVRGRTAAATVLRRAREAGFQTSAELVSEDSDRFMAVVGPALPELDVLFVNEFEAQRSTGVAVRDGSGNLVTDGIREAAVQLHRGGVRRLVFVHFPEGGYARDVTGKDWWHGSVRVPADWIAGAAGAGDAFTAGALLGLLEGAPLERCLRMAVCAAACSLSDLSCSAGIRPLRAALQIGSRWGFRDLG